jgi:hypothetical protein
MHPSAGIDVILRMTSGVERVRPYFWSAGAAAWIPLGGDAVAGVGTTEVSADASVLNKAAHGRFVGLGRSAYVMLLKGSGGGTISYAEVTERVGDPR